MAALVTIVLSFSARAQTPPATWVPVEGLYGGQAIALAARDDGTLFAAMTDGLYRRRPGDAAWTRRAFADRNVQALRLLGDRLAVLVGGRPLFSDDEGATWTAPLGTLTFRTLATRSTTDVLVGGDQTHASLDGGRTWQRSPAAPAPSTGAALAADGSWLVHAAAPNGGASTYRSADQGTTWHLVHTVAHGLSFIRALADGRLVKGHASLVPETGCGKGLYGSHDDGRTWTRFGLPCGDWFLYSAYASGDTLMAYGSGASYRSLDGGATWSGSASPTFYTLERRPGGYWGGGPAGVSAGRSLEGPWAERTTGFSLTYAEQVIADGRDGVYVLVPGTQGLAYFHSPDEGRTWRREEFTARFGVQVHWYSGHGYAPDGSLLLLGDEHVLHFGPSGYWAEAAPEVLPSLSSEIVVDGAGDTYLCGRQLWRKRAGETTWTQLGSESCSVLLLDSNKNLWTSDGWNLSTPSLQTKVLIRQNTTDIEYFQGQFWSKNLLDSVWVYSMAQKRWESTPYRVDNLAVSPSGRYLYGVTDRHTPEPQRLLIVGPSGSLFTELPDREFNYADGLALTSSQVFSFWYDHGLYRYRDGLAVAAAPDEPVATAGLRVSPNPARTSARVVWEGHGEDAELEVYDVLGRQVYRATLAGGSGSHTLPVAQWPAGVYVVHLSEAKRRAHTALLRVVR